MNDACVSLNEYNFLKVAFNMKKMHYYVTIYISTSQPVYCEVSKVVLREIKNIYSSLISDLTYFDKWCNKNLQCFILKLKSIYIS